DHQSKISHHAEAGTTLVSTWFSARHPVASRGAPALRGNRGAADFRRRPLQLDAGLARSRPKDNRRQPPPGGDVAARHSEDLPAPNSPFADANRRPQIEPPYGAARTAATSAVAPRGGRRI